MDYEAESGEIWIDGPCPRERLGLTPSNWYGFSKPDNQFVGATVEDDVAFGLENQGLPREEMKKSGRIFGVGRMLDFKNREPARLSGGQNTCGYWELLP